MIVEYIDQYRHEFGVEPICRTLTAAGTQIAPSTYYAFKTRPPSKRALRDEELLVEIHRVHAANFGVIDWFNHRRLHGEIGMIPPVELEDTYHHNHPAPAPADAALASL